MALGAVKASGGSESFGGCVSGTGTAEVEKVGAARRGKGAETNHAKQRKNSEGIVS